MGRYADIKRQIEAARKQAEEADARGERVDITVQPPRSPESGMDMPDELQVMPLPGQPIPAKPQGGQSPSGSGKYAHIKREIEAKSKAKPASLDTSPETLLKTKALEQDPDTGVVDPITGKQPERELPDYAGASFGSEIKAGFVDDPKAKMRIYAGARFPDLPIEEAMRRYGVSDGEIVFVDDDGQLRRETPDAFTSKAKRFLGEEIARSPATIGGAAGTIAGTIANPLIGGPIGAATGAAAGEGIRKAIGGLALGDKQGPLDYAVDMGVEGISALGGELLGRALAAGINKARIAKGGGLKYGMKKELKRGYLSPEDQIKAERLEQLASEIGINLAPHQLYDKQSMTDTWRYLRKDPRTSDLIQEFERMQDDQVEDVFTNTIGNMIRPDDTPSKVGSDLQSAAEKAILSKVDEREAKTGPMFDAALKGKQADADAMSSVIADLDAVIESVPWSMKSLLQKTKKDLIKQAEKQPAAAMGAVPDYPMSFAETRTKLTDLLKDKTLSSREQKTVQGIFDEFKSATTRGQTTQTAVGLNKTLSDAISKASGTTDEPVLKQIKAALESDLKGVSAKEFKGQYVDTAKLADELQENIVKLNSANTSVEPDFDAIVKALEDRKVPAMKVLKESDEGYRNRITKDYQRIFKTDVPMKSTIGPEEVARLEARNAEIDEILKSAQPGQDVYAKVAEYDAAAGGGPKVTPDTDMERLHKAKVILDDLIEGRSRDGIEIPPSLQNIVARDLVIIKDKLLKTMDATSPGYAVARSEFRKATEPIEALEKSIIGEIARLKNDGTVRGAATKLIGSQNKLDKRLLLFAKKELSKQDPELMKRAVGSFMLDTWEGLKGSANGGDVANAAGQMYKKLFGSKRQRDLLEAALDPQEFENLRDVMEVISKVSIGKSGASDTASFQQIREEMKSTAGSTIAKVGQVVLTPKDSLKRGLFDKWNDLFMAGNQAKLFDALTQPEVTRQIKKMKLLEPETKEFIRAAAVVTTMIATDMGISAFEKSSRRDETPQKLKSQSGNQR